MLWLILIELLDNLKDCKSENPIETSNTNEMKTIYIIKYHPDIRKIITFATPLIFPECPATLFQEQDPLNFYY